MPWTSAALRFAEPLPSRTPPPTLARYCAKTCALPARSRKFPVLAVGSSGGNASEMVFLGLARHLQCLSGVT